jgi:hypothetical protein
MQIKASFDLLYERIKYEVWPSKWTEPRHRPTDFKVDRPPTQTQRIFKIKGIDL